MTSTLPYTVLIASLYSCLVRAVSIIPSRLALSAEYIIKDEDTWPADARTKCIYLVWSVVGNKREGGLCLKGPNVHSTINSSLFPSSDCGSTENNVAIFPMEGSTRHLWVRGSLEGMKLSAWIPKFHMHSMSSSDTIDLTRQHSLTTSYHSLHYHRLKLIVTKCNCAGYV